MPTRIIRDGILTSPRINTLSESAELFYRRLMSVVDDHARYFADTMLLHAACYPRRLNKITESAIASHLAECKAAGVLRTYAVDGQEYLELLDFKQRVQSKSKFPDPPEITDDHGNPPCSTVKVRLDGVVDVVGCEGAAETPSSKKRRPKKRLFVEWADDLSGPAVPTDDPLFDWAQSVGIPREWIAIAWWIFEARYDESDKAYSDWRAVFRKAVREDWLKAWRQTRSGEWELTTAGIQAQREMAS